MTDIVLLGINHKTAPVELRECIAFTDENTGIALDSLKTNSGINEALLLSTCNRVEVLLVTDDASVAIDSAKKFIAEFNNIPLTQFEDSLYIHRGDEAVRHVFRVASSLDSMIVGEPQILGQIKDAYKTATEKKISGVIINRLLHRTFFVAKRVRTETGIGDSAVSISYAAIELARKIFGDLDGKRVLLIGAGEMAELAVEHLIRNRASDIRVANRTFEHGLKLARKFNGQAVRIEELIDCLKVADIIISSTGSPGFILTHAQVKGMIRKRRNRPLFFIDIAVPRDIDPDINKLANNYVYDIDDLKGVIEDNVEERNREAIKGERIVDEAVIRFREWRENLAAVPTIKDLRNKLESIAEKEVNKTLRSNNISQENAEAVHRMTRALINKILHDPTQVLKNNSCMGDKSNYLDITRKLFKLDE